VDVSTGQQLDMARDITPSSVNSRHVPGAPQSNTTGPKDGHLAPALADVSGAVPLDPGWVQNVPKMRVLTFDRPAKPGQVRIVVPGEIQAEGLWVEVQQPNTHITLSGQAKELNFSFGDEAVVTATVMNDEQPVSSAVVDGWIELPGHENGGSLSFTPEGNGKYTAKVPLASAEWKYVGVWGLHLHATGATSGVPFERHVESAFGYYPAHAHMTGIGAPVLTRGSDGLVDEVSVDVDVETLADDRFSVKGTLTYTAQDGTEHGLARAQTGQFVSAGKGTITLHFDSASLALARVSGPFHFRDVVLVSQAGSITQHRLGRALDIVTPAIANREIRFPTQLSRQAQELVDNGDLPPVK
jgi:hypothetical protein